MTAIFSGFEAQIMYYLFWNTKHSRYENSFRLCEGIIWLWESLACSKSLNYYWEFSFQHLSYQFCCTYYYIIVVPGSITASLTCFVVSISVAWSLHRLQPAWCFYSASSNFWEFFTECSCFLFSRSSARCIYVDHLWCIAV